MEQIDYSIILGIVAVLISVVTLPIGQHLSKRESSKIIEKQAQNLIDIQKFRTTDSHNIHFNKKSQKIVIPVTKTLTIRYNIEPFRKTAI